MGERFHVLQIVGEPVGGIRRHIHAIIRGLAPTGIIQSYVYSETLQDSRFKAEYGEIKEILSGRVFSMPIKKRPGPGDLYNLWRLVSYVKRENVSLVHGHGAKGGAYARLLSLICGVKCVYTPHGGAVHRMFGAMEELVYSMVEKLLYLLTDRFVFESEYSRDAYFSKVRRPISRSVVNHNGIVAHLGPEPGGPVGPAPAAGFSVGVFGILRKVKGQEKAIAAARVLRERGVPVSLHLYGDGPDRVRLEKIAVQYGLGSWVEFHGEVPNPEVHMGKMHVVLIPSLFESFGYVALEAFSLGKPVVASRTGGLTEIISDGENGLLVPPGDPAGIADALSRLFHDEELSRRLTDKARQKLQESFGMERMIGALKAVYEDVLSGALPEPGREVAE
jgi:glycosyltransferase involved in cell wall biosynthesis